MTDNPYTGGSAIVWMQGYQAGRNDFKPKPPPFTLSPSIGITTESILQQRDRGMLSFSFPSMPRESIIITDVKRICLREEHVLELLAWAKIRLGPYSSVDEGNTCVEHTYKFLGLLTSDELRGNQPMGMACGMAWYPKHVVPVILTSNRKVLFIDAFNFVVQERNDVPNRVYL
jgi:hypothetical protein